MDVTKPAPPRSIRERHDARIPALVHHGWTVSFPWLAQGTTTRGAPGRELDFGIFSGGSPESVVHKNWGRLLALTSMSAGVHARQEHGADVLFHDSSRPGLHLVGPCDGHVTDRAGVLLAVAAADCVPVFVVDPEARAVGLLHAGWRGAAAGVLERGVGLVTERTGAPLSTLFVHLGPAICERCYEVGPEVFEALGERIPRRPTRIDLRAVLAKRATALGVDPRGITVSEHCTRCTGSGLFSHRGGDRGRQVGYLGIRP
jgi:purine-nucleoside/S-methyl-5'-thioadenosine phosphorylase / adenosine deaminase